MLVTCLCDNLDSVIAKLSDAELLVSEENCDQNDRFRILIRPCQLIIGTSFAMIIMVIMIMYLRCQYDGDDVPRDAHCLQIGSIVLVI